MGPEHECGGSRPDAHPINSRHMGRTACSAPCLPNDATCPGHGETIPVQAVELLSPALAHNDGSRPLVTVAALTLVVAVMCAAFSPSWWSITLAALLASFCTALWIGPILRRAAETQTRPAPPKQP